MNIFPFKKQKYPLVGLKQKLFLVLTIILVAISIFPVFRAIPKVVEAQGPRGVDCNAFDPTSPLTFQSRVYVDKTDTSLGAADRTYAVGTANKTGPATQILKKDEKLLVYVEVTMPAEYNECYQGFANEFKFQIHIYGTTSPKRFPQTANFDVASKKWFTTFSLNGWTDFDLPEGEQAYIYFCRTSGCNATDGNNNDYIERFGVKSLAAPIVAATVTPPSSPLLTGGTTTNPEVPVKIEDIKLKITQKPGGETGLRDKYRVSLEDNPMNLLLSKIWVDWGSETKLVDGNYFTLPAEANTWGLNFTPQYKGVLLGLNYADKGSPKCEYSALSKYADCSKVVFGWGENDKGTEISSAYLIIPNEIDITLPESRILAELGTKDALKAKTVEAAKPVGSEEFKVINIVNGVTSASGQVFAIVGNPGGKFTVEVYKTKADVIQACKNDGKDVPAGFCDNYENASTKIGGFVEVTSSSDQKSDATTVKQSLYAFIIELISQLVIIMTQIIYQIFALFIVPVLNALLNVRPYQDAFVNIIYPGWLILRNLANIFFIICLLVVGLRILFQQSAASVARGFIIKLVLMALLVNFSLVIGQGIVGIADTVQSQFLPGDTRVIEALGTKLMVEPIQSFRTAVTNSETGTVSSDSFADLAKPIILLMLAVAAFFAFIAVAAFLAVRLVALMLLYMISPIAYIGYVMDETRGSTWGKWWDEFMKYAFMTPILVFFLNIAALIATATSSNVGNVITIGDNIADDLVTGGITIITHFIVILVLFAGMKFALSFSAASSKGITKKITDFAENGFKNTFKKPAQWLGSGAKAGGMWAKDFAGDNASEALKKRGYGKSAALVSALSQPAITSKALREKFFTEPKKKQMERLAQKREGLEKFASNVGNNKWQATKMAAWKLRGKGAGFFRNQADDLKGIMSDKERDDVADDLTAAKDDLAEVNRRIAEGDKYISKKQGEKYRDGLDTSIEETTKKHDEKIASLIADKGSAIAVGNKARVSEIEKEINDTQKDYESRLETMKKARTDINDRLESLPAGTGADETMEMADAISAGKALTINAETLNAGIKNMDSSLEKDKALRKTYGFEGQVIDEAKKNLILKQAEQLESIAAKREFPNSPGDVAARNAKENEEGKKYDGIDDVDTLRVAFNEAMKKNNVAAATAIAKKLSKEGGFADLLKEHGYNNNIEDFKKFMDEKFKSAPVTVRNQIASEISYINGQNGNRALASATKIDADRVVRFNTIPDQQSKLEKSAAKKPLWERKKSDITYQKNGKNVFNAGEFEAINKITPNSLKDISRRVKPDVAKHILDTAAEHNLPLRADVAAWLKHTMDPAKYSQPSP